MANATEQRKAYSTDLTDEQWAVVGPLIPGAKNTHGGRPQTVCLREVLNAILYLNRTGCQWDMLPHDLLPKSTVYDYFAQWRDDGTLVGVTTALRTRIRVNDGRASRRPAQRASTASRSKPPRSAAMAADTTEARKSKGENAICWSIHWGC